MTTPAFLDNDEAELAARDSARWLRPEIVAPWWEIALVLAVMLGPFIYSSTNFALKSGSPDFIRLMLTTYKFTRMIALESALLAVMFFYLNWRGWTPADFKICITWHGTIIMPLVAIGAALANITIALLLKVLVIAVAPHPHGMIPALLASSHHLTRHSVDIAWLPLLVTSVVNAYLEELVFMGYAFNQFAARRGPFFALMGMVFLRMLLHTYKGPLEMLGIASFSFVYGLIYWKMRKLWPLILGHASIDFVAFSAIKLLFGR